MGFQLWGIKPPNHHHSQPQLWRRCPWARCRECPWVSIFTHMTGSTTARKELRKLSLPNLCLTWRTWGEFSRYGIWLPMLWGRYEAQRNLEPTTYQAFPNFIFGW
ncbi:unnamed protein product [Tuber aestivum]|uniref:Uncharacterized protein n=1 Tax=Tuber aestivum TaxID=59557 RepID=A0A292Q214_9PEZI|nr:unnamed protein product [Tuber aestivum]